MTDNNMRGNGYGKGKGNHPSKRQNSWLIALIVVLVLTLTVGVVFTSLAYIGGARLGSSSGSSIGGGSVAVLDVTGEIGDVSARSTYNHNWTMNTINDLIHDSSNKGIVIRVNSPGGSVYTSDELYEQLMKYKNKTKRPVYFYFRDQAASGGYYIAMAGDKIYANRNTWTGSIGVKTGTIYDVRGLLDKLGIKTNTITSGRNKAMGSMTEELTDEQREIMQSLIDEAYDQFVRIVAKGRNMSEGRVREIADGRIYSASQSKELGLIDGICNEETFFDTVRTFRGMKDVSFDFMEPEESDSMYDLLQQFVQSKRSSGKADEYQQLIELSKNGNKFTVMYLADIEK